MDVPGSTGLGELRISHHTSPPGKPGDVPGIHRLCGLGISYYNTGQTGKCGTHHAMACHDTQPLESRNNTQRRKLEVLMIWGYDRELRDVPQTTKHDTESILGITQVLKYPQETWDS